MHRTTPRFWRHFEQLPRPVQKVARESESFGLFVSGLITEHSLLKTDPISSGFGLENTTNVIG